MTEPLKLQQAVSLNYEADLEKRCAPLSLVPGTKRAADPCYFSVDFIQSTGLITPGVKTTRKEWYSFNFTNQKLPFDENEVYRQQLEAAIFLLKELNVGLKLVVPGDQQNAIIADALNFITFDPTQYQPLLANKYDDKILLNLFDQLYADARSLTYLPKLIKLINNFLIQKSDKITEQQKERLQILRQFLVLQYCFISEFKNVFGEEISSDVAKIKLKEQMLIALKQLGRSVFGVEWQTTGKTLAEFKKEKNHLSKYYAQRARDLAIALAPVEHIIKEYAQAFPKEIPLYDSLAKAISQWQKIYRHEYDNNDQQIIVLNSKYAGQVSTIRQRLAALSMSYQDAGKIKLASWIINDGLLDASTIYRKALTQYYGSSAYAKIIVETFLKHVTFDNNGVPSEVAANEIKQDLLDLYAQVTSEDQVSFAASLDYILNIFANGSERGDLVMLTFQKGKLQYDRNFHYYTSDRRTMGSIVHWSNNLYRSLTTVKPETHVEFWPTIVGVSGSLALAGFVVAAWQGSEAGVTSDGFKGSVIGGSVALGAMVGDLTCYGANIQKNRWLCSVIGSLAFGAISSAVLYGVDDLNPNSTGPVIPDLSTRNWYGVYGPIKFGISFY